MRSNQIYTALIESDDISSLSRTKIFDCSADLQDANHGIREFIESHIPGSYHLSIERDLSGLPGKKGRHPLPTKKLWINRIQELGINNADQIVLYDTSGGFFAARAWWMFRWVGHANVAVLNGGLSSWDGLSESGKPTSPKKSDFRERKTLTKLVSLQELRSASSYQMIDARSVARWAGREEPIDKMGGHIPNALCYPFIENLDQNNKFKSANQLANRFKNLKEPIICYCGSGVTATHNILAMKIAGLAEPALYAGSWSEWIQYPDNPIAKDEGLC